MAVLVAPRPPQPGVKRVNQDLTPTQSQIDYERDFAAWVSAVANASSSGIPFPTLTTIGGVKAATAPTHQFQRGIDTSGNPLFAQPAAVDISGLGPFATASSIAVGSITGLGSLATLSSVDLASQVTGNLTVSHLNSGIDANSSHFWRGDGTWATVTASAGGSSGQVQFNNAGSLGGFTVGGDGSLDVTTGLLSVTKTGGVAFGPSATNASTVGTGSVALSANPSFTGTATFSTISASTAGITTATIVTAHTTNFDATTATINTATIGSLTTNTVAGGFANLSNSTNAAQLHLSGTGLDNGGYVLGHATNEIYLGGGASFDGSVWTAKATTSSILGNGAGALLFWSDSGLTIGSTFSPTIRFSLDATGAITQGIWSGTVITVAKGGTGVATASANQIFSGPSSGAAAAPAFRSLVGADLPNPSSTTLGGIQSKAAVASQWLTSISTAGVPALSQPAFTDISGTATAAQGGTGQSSYTTGDLLYASGSTALSKLAAVATGKVLRAKGTSTAPAWEQVVLTTDVTGTLPIANGGTGDTGTAWTSYSPTLSAGSGTFTSAVVTSAAYRTIGKSVFLRIYITVTTNGTAASWVQITLPVNATVPVPMSGWNDTTTKGLSGLASSGNMYIRNYDGTYPAANGSTLFISGVYESV